MNLYPLLSMLFQHQEGDFFFPSRASENAGVVDWIFYFIFYVSLFAFIVIVLATIIFAIRYRRTKVGMNPEDSPSHSSAIEILWSVIPAIPMVLMFYWGFEDFVDRKTPPANSYEIQVKAYKWQWEYVYPGGVTSYGGHDSVVASGQESGEGLVVPVNTNIKLRIESSDVLHAFSVPAFRIKMDAVPGRYTYAWFKATELGEFTIFCAEYCGTRHSRMLSKVTVLPEDEYQEWIQNNKFDPSLAPNVRGKKLFAAKCTACHPSDGSPGIGPGLKGLYGKDEQLADGSVIKADENYIRRSVLDPQADVVAGYENILMPSFAGQLSDQELSDILEYIKIDLKD